MSKTPANTEMSIAEIDSLFIRTNVEHPDPADIEQLRKVFKDNPRLLRMSPDLIERARDAVIDKMRASGLLKEHLRARALAMRDDLGWRDASCLEQILIDAVVISYLQYGETVKDYEECVDGRHPISHGEYWDKRMTGALKRLTKATEALAKVRKLGRRTPELLTDLTQLKDVVM